MSELFARLTSFLAQFKLLVIILPWERAVRIRLGSRVTIWEPGWHIKMPLLDEILPLNTRLRISDTPGQTLTTSDGATLTVGLSIGFRINDPLAALLKMQQPETSCSAIAASAVSALVSTQSRASLTVSDLERHVKATLELETTYEFEFVRVRDFAYTRTFRLLNSNDYHSAGLHIEERKV